MGLASFLHPRLILQLILVYIFVASGLLINLLQLCTLPIWPISRRLYRVINCRLAYSHWSQLVLLLEWWSGTECTIFANPEDKLRFGHEHAIVVLNHNFEIDFLCGWTLCERFGVLGSSKVVAKRELAFMPLVGWTWCFMEVVFLRRRWAEDFHTVKHSLQRLKDYPENIWLLLHCEGTRFTKEKHAASMAVAASKGLPLLKHHLLPRTRGFCTCLFYLKGTVSAVYDCTLNFRGSERPTLQGLLKGHRYHADMCIRRIPVETIPEDDKECAAWLHRLYQEKDALQDEYERSGLFPGEPSIPPRRMWPVLNWLFWASLLLSPLLHFATSVFSSGSAISIATFLSVMLLVSLGVRQMIGMTEIHKGSTYGQSINKEK